MRGVSVDMVCLYYKEPTLTRSWISQSAHNISAPMGSAQPPALNNNIRDSFSQTLLAESYDKSRNSWPQQIY